MKFSLCVLPLVMAVLWVSRNMQLKFKLITKTDVTDDSHLKLHRTLLHTAGEDKSN